MPWNRNAFGEEQLLLAQRRIEQVAWTEEVGLLHPVSNFQDEQRKVAQKQKADETKNACIKRSNSQFSL